MKHVKITTKYNETLSAESVYKKLILSADNGCVEGGCLCEVLEGGCEAG